MRKYSEHQLRLQPAKSYQGAAPTLVSAMEAATSAPARERLVRETLRAIGFDWLAYGTLTYAPPEVTPRTFFASYANKSWADRYFSERHYEVDPRHFHAPCSGFPLVWDVRDVTSWIEAYPTNVRTKRFIDDFRDSGIRSGVFFSLISPAKAGERTVISLMSTEADRCWITDGVIGQALTLGLCMHEFLVNHACVASIGVEQHAVMSEVQKDILRCLVEGLCDKEIARRLDLTAYNVDYHLRQLRKRFSVHNRVQLVNAAMASGWAAAAVGEALVESAYLG